MACGPNCTCTIFHQEVLDKVEENRLSNDAIKLSSDYLQIVANPTRMKLINAVSIDELCVCDLAHLLGVTKSAVSHQMRILKDANIVKSNRRGKMVYYKIKDIKTNELIKNINSRLGDSNA